jgi:predicted nucleotide-binding protein
VVLEFGYFMGRLNRDRVCCLYKGNIELPSDMHGICYLHFNNSVNEIKQIILKELKAVGYDTNV